MLHDSAPLEVVELQLCPFALLFKMAFLLHLELVINFPVQVLTAKGKLAFQKKLA